MNRKQKKQRIKRIKSRQTRTICSKCGKHGRHYVMTDYSDGGGFWICDVLYGPDGRRIAV